MSLLFLAPFLQDTRPWLDPALFGALVGGGGGAFVGTAFGLLGAWSGWALPRGRHLRPILAAVAFMLVLGLATLGLGAFALYQGQPAFVWAILLGLGAFTAAMAFGLRAVVLTRARLLGLA